MTFSTADIPSMSGKVVVVTGANTGIGKVTALELARKDAHVFLACRSEEKTKPVIEEIKSETKNDKVEFLPLDLSSLKSVKACADTFLARKLPLHVLVNNAGVMMLPNFTKTADDLEMQWGTNHLGHFYMTKLLLPVIEKSAPSRIVNLSSSAHKSAKESYFVMDKLNDSKEYGSMRAYSSSKASNILFSLRLDKMLQEKGIKNVWVNSVHPGVVNTDLWRNIHWSVRPLVQGMASLFFLSPLQGALTSLYVASHPDIAEKDIHAKYFVPIAKQETPTSLCQNEKLAEELWAYSEKVVQEKTGSV